MCDLFDVGCRILVVGSQKTEVRREWDGTLNFEREAFEP
jgi:hypothetical protein